MQKILLIEDQEDILRGLAVNLTREGYRVLKASRGDTGLALALKEAPHLILLDVMLPGMNGLDVCRDLRKHGIDVPIIMLTAKSEELDRVVGLEIGADDYVTKPFSVRELVARIHAHLRRQPTRANELLTHYRFGDVEIDFEKLRVTRKGQAVELTSKEFAVLQFLIRHRGEVVTRDQLLDQVWGYESYPSTRTVDNHILNLRHKLERDPAKPQHILTAHGEGYKFVG